MKIKRFKNYTPQQGDVVKHTFWLPTAKEIILGIILLCIALAVYSSWNTQEELSKEQIDIKILERYEDIYSDNFYTDKEIIRVEEEQSMLARIHTRESEVIAKYWKEAKEEILIGFKEYVEASPEVVELLVDMPEPKDLEFTAQNDYNDLQSYLQAKFPESPMIGLDVIQICKESNITAWQCRLGLAIIKHESRYGTAYAGGRPDLGNVIYHNYAGVKCDTRLRELKGKKACQFPDENGMYITKFNSPESFLRYFFEQIIGKNWGVCKTTACMSPKYVAPSGERNINWENKINGEILNLHFINY